MRVFRCACSIALFLTTASVTSWAKDITRQVINQTDLDEEVAQACLDYWQGNRRHGSLTRVLVNRSGTQTCKFRVDNISLENDQIGLSSLAKREGAKSILSRTAKALRAVFRPAHATLKVGSCTNLSQRRG